MCPIKVIRMGRTRKNRKGAPTPPKKPRKSSVQLTKEDEEREVPVIIDIDMGTNESNVMDPVPAR